MVYFAIANHLLDGANRTLESPAIYPAKADVSASYFDSEQILDTILRICQYK